ncbi:hypothetical protein PSTT_15607 [Puccinia striiformis]|uniref:Uncharacterized protein n=1 Tax=Puccinia striiformis TaxID=27350 RepID=A0A2S4UH91_9BASI|nr:hypothetical protein PSTT_15607 [Puccinia striiformis]
MSQDRRNTHTRTTPWAQDGTNGHPSSFDILLEWLASNGNEGYHRWITSEGQRPELCGEILEMLYLHGIHHRTTQCEYPHYISHEQATSGLMVGRSVICTSSMAPWKVCTFYLGEICHLFGNVLTKLDLRSHELDLSQVVTNQQDHGAASGFNPQR